MTGTVKNAAEVLNIKLLDHIIVGDNTYFSFAGEGLIEKYELDFLRMKTRSVSRARTPPPEPY